MLVDQPATDEGRDCRRNSSRGRPDPNRSAACFSLIDAVEQGQAVWQEQAGTNALQGAAGEQGLELSVQTSDPTPNRAVPITSQRRRPW